MFKIPTPFFFQILFLLFCPPPSFTKLVLIVRKYYSNKHIIAIKAIAMPYGNVSLAFSHSCGYGLIHEGFQWLCAFQDIRSCPLLSENGICSDTLCIFLDTKIPRCSGGMLLQKRKMDPRQLIAGIMVWTPPLRTASGVPSWKSKRPAFNTKEESS